MTFSFKVHLTANYNQNLKLRNRGYFMYVLNIEKVREIFLL